MLLQFATRKRSFLPLKMYPLRVFCCFEQVSLDYGFQIRALLALMAFRIARCVIGYLIFDHNDKKMGA